MTQKNTDKRHVSTFKRLWNEIIFARQFIYATADPPEDVIERLKSKSSWYVSDNGEGYNATVEVTPDGEAYDFRIQLKQKQRKPHPIFQNGRQMRGSFFGQLQVRGRIVTDGGTGDTLVQGMVHIEFVFILLLVFAGAFMVSQYFTRGDILPSIILIPIYVFFWVRAYRDRNHTLTMLENLITGEEPPASRFSEKLKASAPVYTGETDEQEKSSQHR